MKDITYLESQLSAFKTLTHGFFKRLGGRSIEEPYISLNCQLKAKSDPFVLENLKLVSKSLTGSDRGKIKLLSQVHSSKVVYLNRLSQDSANIEADALVTTIPNMVIGVVTADCAPILMADVKGEVVAAIHAGWRGALGGIIENTAEKMMSLGAKNIQAAIGPCIHQESYQVDKDFKKKFLAADNRNEIFFTPDSKQGHYLFDLPAFCKEQLKLVGINTIEILPYNTFSNEDFFSFRRNTIRPRIANQVPRSGAQISCISLG